MHKEIIYITMKGCPYCRAADVAIEELRNEKIEYNNIKITRYEDMSPKAQKYGKDYYYVPSMFVDGKKKYKAHPGETVDKMYMQMVKQFGDEDGLKYRNIVKKAL